MDYNEERDFLSRVGDGTDAEQLYLKGLLDRLFELREQSHPRHGDASKCGKDLRAFQALRIAHDLVDLVAGWAIDHQLGLAAEGLAFVPLGPTQTRELPTDKDARVQVDTHDHERVGSALQRCIAGQIDPMVMRRAAANLLHANPGAWPAPLSDELGKSLRALDMNDVRPMLRPVPSGRKVTLDIEGLQLIAVCSWRFRQASKLMSSLDALAEVANAFGVGVDAVRGWEPRLRETLGHLVVSRNTDFAKNRGSYLTEEPSRSRGLSKLEEDHEFGTAALTANGEKFKAALRAKKASIQ